MIWSGMNKDMFAALPELEAQALKTFDYYGDEEPGIYLTFESVLIPHLRTAAESSPHEVSRVMAFIEHVASLDESLVMIGLGETLATFPQKAIIRAEAGPLTLRALDKVERAHIRQIRDRESSPLLHMLSRVLRGKKKTC